MKINNNLKKYILILFVPVIFLVISLLTLSDYGINWDSPKHFIRGQAYLHFILTGKRDFLDYPAPFIPKGAPDFVDFNVETATNSSLIKQRRENIQKIRRSYFQSDFYTYDYFLTKHEHTHPEVNDLLLAFSNYIFYQNLQILSDIEAYHLLVVLSTFILIVAVSFWIYFHFGFVASIVASSSLAFYPLVFAESHFNIKDPMLMTFFGLAILLFNIGFSNRKPLFIVLSAVSAGLALGTKFNAIFLPLILGLWLISYLVPKLKNHRISIDVFGGKRILSSLLLYPLITFGLFYIFSPYLWIDPIRKVLDIINYYKEIGSGTPPELLQFIIGGWNIYPLIWILYTTPLPILILSAMGLLYSLYLIKFKKRDYPLLILLWFIIPILRVTWPGANIYGGVRQIMEFIPAMAILSGIGAGWIVQCVKARLPACRQARPDEQRKVKSVIAPLFLLITFYLLLLPIIKYHPYENVYFNELIGGLKGAKEKGMPSWGNTYGSVYLQGIEWINKNAERNAKLTLPVNYISSIPRLKLRRDIDLNNDHFSGLDRRGEYAMEMYYDWPLKSRYKYAYLENFLDPVYQAEVDGVPLLKIWKNDLDHTKKGFEWEIEIEPQSIVLENQYLRVNFKDQVLLTKLIIEHSANDCEKQDEEGFVTVSTEGKEFTRYPNPLFDPESPYLSEGMNENTFVYQFAATPAVSLSFNPNKSNSCILKNYRVKVWGLR